MSWCTIESDPGINLLILATVLHFTDAIPINKQLYSFSYVCFTAGAAGVVFSAFYVLKIRLGTCSWRKPLKFSLLREEFLIALDTFSHTETHQESIKRFQSYLNDRDTSLLSVGIKRATSSINRNGFESLLNVYKETDALQKKTRILRFMVLCLYRAKHKRSGSAQGPNTMIIHPRHSGSDQDAVKITVTGSSVTGGATSETLSLGSGGPSDMHIVEAGNIVISIQVLRNVPNNFSRENILGRGGFGTVYKCELHDGTKIAVKRMESGVMSEKGLDEFKSEIAVLTKVRHQHLVALLGYCLDGNERIILVYMSNLDFLEENDDEVDLT